MRFQYSTETDSESLIGPCHQHHLELVLIGDIQYLDDFAIRYLLIRIECHEDIGISGICGLQERGDSLEGHLLLALVGVCHVIVQVLVDGQPGYRLCLRLLLRFGQQHLDGVWHNDGGGYHEEDEQQEDDVGHRCHAEVCFHIESLF